MTTLCPLMRRPPDQTPPVARRLPHWFGACVALALLLAGCSTGGSSSGGLADPAHSVAPVPDYLSTCAPVGIDSTIPCLRMTLKAIDAARAAEGVRPMELPADFPELTVPEQVFVAIDRERVDRGLAPFTGLSSALDTDAQKGADAARLPARPGPAYGSMDTEWIGGGDNGLCAGRFWLYNHGAPRAAADRVARDARPLAVGPTGTSSSPGSGHRTSSWEPPSTRPATHRVQTPAGPHWRPCSARLPGPGTLPIPGSRRSPPCPRGGSDHWGRSLPPSPI